MVSKARVTVISAAIGAAIGGGAVAFAIAAGSAVLALLALASTTFCLARVTEASKGLDR